MFRDDEWPYGNGDHALALTTLTFDKVTGRILDADVEINSASTSLTTTDTDVRDDLASIVTHETGHFLGLAHENLKVATMNPNYHRGSVDFRSLEADDVAGICAVYPPDRPAPDCPGGPDPLHGFSRYCNEGETGTVRSGLSVKNDGGCACSFDHTSGRTWGPWWLLAYGAGGLLRRRFTKKTRGVHD